MTRATGRAATAARRASPPGLRRLRVVIHGAVQGVGFRPFVYRLATELRLAGWVLNSAQGVFIEVEGPREALERFLLRLGPEKPPRAFIQSLESSFLDPAGYAGFEIRQSDGGGAKTALVLPDIATCDDCLREVFDPADRRYLYPFTNCTNCGPRFSIIQALPYDRPNTTMRGFVMCDACRREYEDPRDRRFHAQPNACPACGPRIELWDRDGERLAEGHEALLEAAEAVRRGRILALKGLGGFHLMADARQEGAVTALAERKRRQGKPFALMFPSLEGVRRECAVSGMEARLLGSPESPIVLLERSGGVSDIAPSVAPGNPYLGVMLPYTPLHHVLMRELGFPVVATSGNLSEEPICTDERDALARLSGIADVFLVHNRSIARHVDDSIVRVVMGRELVMRRARGYAPLPVTLRPVPYSDTGASAPPVLAVGAHLKNTIAMSVETQAFLSQHIGDLETPQASDAFKRVIESFKSLYETVPQAVACDLHPGYLSTQHARGLGLPTMTVQHHHAHVLACMAENELDGPVLGVAWDGTGYGTDGMVWGGEFLAPQGDTFVRVAHLRTFRLPGGEAAVKEPRRSAIGLLYALFGDAAFDMEELAPVRAFSPAERRLLAQALGRGVNAPVTSSAGRLFDAVAAIADLRQRTRFEGQAAMDLEYALHNVQTDEQYELAVCPPDCPHPVADSVGAHLPPRGEGTRRSPPLREGQRESSAGPPQGPLSPAGGGGLPPQGAETLPFPFVVDWSPMLRALLEDVRVGVPADLVSARFHNGLAECIVDVARCAGLERVVLTGGCFQNRYLTERAARRLAEEGFRPYWHQRVPPNDGGIALGQLVAASLALSKKR